MENNQNDQPMYSSEYMIGTKEEYIHIVKKIYYAVAKPAIITYIIIIVCGFFLLIANAINGKFDAVYIGVMAGLIVAMTMQPGQFAEKSFKSGGFKAIGNPGRVTFFGQYFECADRYSWNRYSYTEIENVVFMENYLILKMGSQFCILNYVQLKQANMVNFLGYLKSMGAKVTDSDIQKAMTI